MYRLRKSARQTSTWRRCLAEREEQTLRYAQLSAQLSAELYSPGLWRYYTTLRCSQYTFYGPWIESFPQLSQMVQSLPGFLDLCLNVCSPSQVLGDVYTEVLETAHPLNSNVKALNGHSVRALNGGGRIFHSPSSLIFPACSPVLSDLLRDSLCTALQTEKLWIWSTGLSMQLTPSSRQEAWVPGNLSALTERSQLGIRWTCGESCV